MKNNLLLILLAASAFISSCGTMSKSAHNTSSGFVNSIYYTPDPQKISDYNQSKAQLGELQNQTSDYLDKRSESMSYTGKGITQTIFVGDTNVVDIDYNPNYTYSIMDDDESYEARLRKFDSPVYTINIEWNDPYYYEWDFWHRPYWATVGTTWYNPWWGGYYSWYGPSWNWHSWHNRHWYHPCYSSAWYDPWYDPWYGHGWYDPWYGHGWYPAPHPPHANHGRDIYYGKRNSGPSYEGRSNMNQIRGNGHSGNTAIRGNASSSGNRNTVTQSNRKPASPQGSMYRRSATQNTRQSSASSARQNEEQYQQNNTRNNNTNSYYRNSNSSNYNRSSSSYGNSGSSSRSSSGSYNTGRSGSGSSYRR